MKLLTILINNRIDHIVNFDRGTEIKAPDSYIVENDGSKTSMFNFYCDDELDNDSVLINVDGRETEAKLDGLAVDNLGEEDSVSKINMHICLKLGDVVETEDEDDDDDDDDPYSSSPRRRTVKKSATPSPTHVQKADMADWVSTIDRQYWDSKKCQVLFKPNPDKIYRVVVMLSLRENDQDSPISQSFTIHVAPMSHICDVVLDYGSEASQLLVHHRNIGHSITLDNWACLFGLFKTSLDEDGEDNDYLQYDSDGKNSFGYSLMKTLYFAKKPDASEQNAPDSDVPEPDVAKDNGKDQTDYSEKSLSIGVPTKENKDVKFLTKFSELESIRSSYVPIPNIKIAGHGGVITPTIRDELQVDVPLFQYENGFYYKSILKAFLYQAVRNALSQQKQTKSKGPLFLNVHLLVPNIYTQAQITMNLVYVTEMVEELSKIDMFKSIKGVEVSSVSESDASFLGYMSQLDPGVKVTRPEGRYLIMDAGKGTLDFSVLDYKPRPDLEIGESQYENVFRSGIIGAGNALTYAMFLDLFRDIYRHSWPNTPEEKMCSDISSFVLKKICRNADESELNKLMKSVEEYKIRYVNGQLTKKNHQYGSVSGYEQLSLNGLNTSIQKNLDNSRLIESLDCFEAMLDCICRTAAETLGRCYHSGQDAKIDYVLFAGRSFMMEQFRTKMVQSLKSLKSGVCADLKPIPWNPDTDKASALKNRCLFIVQPLNAGRYNGRLAGKPQVLHYNPITHEPIDSAEANAPEAESGTKPEKTSKKTSEKKPNLIVRNWKAFLDFLNIGNGADDDIYVSNLSRDNVDSLSRKLVRGFRVSFKSISDQVVIGGSSYSIPRGINYTDGAVLFFDGVDFQICQRGRSVPIGTALDLTGQFVFESMFPYGEPDKAGLIPFPNSQPKSHVTGGAATTRGKDGETPKSSSDEEDSALLERHEGNSLS